MKWLTNSWPIALILLFGTGMRFYGFADWSLSNDELSYLTRFHLPSAWEVFLYGMTVDVHPPAVQTFLYWWTSLFGDSPAAIRLPFVVFGIASIYLIYEVGRTWFSESAGLLSAVFMAGLQFPLLFSRVARPYGFGMFVILLSAFFLGRIISQDKPRLADLIGFAVGLAICAYTHYFCALSATLMAAVGFFYTNASNRKPYLLAGGGSVILFSPYLFYIKQHLSQGGLDDWLPTPTASWLFRFLFNAANGSWALVLVFTSLVVFGLLKGDGISNNRTRIWLCLAVFFGTFLVGFVYSISVEPIMQYSALMFSFPFLLLGVFGLFSLKPKLIGHTVLALVLLIGMDTVAFQRFYQVEHYGVFEELVQKAIEVRNDDPKVLLIADVNHALYLNYYAERLGNNELRFDNYSLTEGDDLKRLHRLCKNAKTENCLLVWSTKGQLPEHAAIVEHYFPKINEVGDHFNSGYVHCSKGVTSEAVFESVFTGAVGDGWNVNESGLKKDLEGYEFILDPSVEFGPTYEVELGETYKGFNAITVTATAQMFNPETGF